MERRTLCLLVCVLALSRGCSARTRVLAATPAVAGLPRGPQPPRRLQTAAAGKATVQGPNPVIEKPVPYAYGVFDGTVVPVPQGARVRKRQLRVRRAARVQLAHGAARSHVVSTSKAAQGRG